MRRPERPPLPALTERDRALLAQLAEHEPLATGELLLLFFTGARTCRVRLAQLEQRRLLLRAYPTAGRKGTSEALWFLTADARALLGAPTRRTPSLSLPDLEHRRAVARFMCSLVERSRGRPGEGLWCWHGETRAQDGAGGHVRPDAYGRYLLPDGELTFYLELDRGTEPAKRVGAKLAGYTAGGGSRALRRTRRKGRPGSGPRETASSTRSLPRSTTSAASSAYRSGRASWGGGRSPAASAAAGKRGACGSGTPVGRRSDPATPACGLWAARRGNDQARRWRPGRRAPGAATARRSPAPTPGRRRPGGGQEGGLRNDLPSAEFSGSMSSPERIDRERRQR